MNRLRWAGLHAGFALTGVLTTLLGPVLPALSARWHLDDAQAGLLFTAQFLGSLSGALTAGRIALRSGVRGVIGAGFVVAAAGVVAVTMGGWAIGLAGVGTYGLGLGLIIPSMNLLVAGMNPSQRAAALNVLNFAWGLGAVAAPPAIAAALDHADLRALLWGLAALLAAAAPVVCGVRADSAAAQRVPEAAGVWRHSWIWCTGAFLFLYVGVENGLAGWMPSYALRVLRAPYSAMAVAQGGFWGAILAIRLLAPALLKRLAAASLILSGLALASLGMLILVALQSTGSLIAGAWIAGAGLAAVFPTAVALFTERAAEQGPRLTGLVFAMAALGGATVPWTMGVLSTRCESLRLGLVAPLVCGIAMIALRPRQPVSSPRQD